MMHLSMEELAAGLDEIRMSPADGGELQLIVRRPGVGERESVAEGVLDVAEGLVGDDWARRRGRTPDGSPDPAAQLTLINSRLVELIAGDPSRWALAGDQLFVDMDLSSANLPPGTRLSVGEAELEVTSMPHTGCSKFAQRYGTEALKFVNAPERRELRLRGMYARVRKSGSIRVGDRVRKSGG
jgi:hypothetical protein